MKKLLATTLALALSFGILSGCSKPAEETAPAEETTEESSAPAEEKEVSVGDPNKKAILVVSFGTSYNDTRAVTIDAIEKDIADAFPEFDVKRAFTSQIIIDKLADRDKLEIDNVEEAMERLIAEDYGTVVCQPTHVMNGFEYDDMVKTVSSYADHFDKLTFGKPLLSSSEDYKNVTKTLTEVLPQTADGEAIVLMGHGTEHPANSTYSALAYQFLLAGKNNIFVGTVEGYPDVDTVLDLVTKQNFKKVYLTPFMVVAGDHANNDMAGDEEDSWKTIFKSAGLEVEPILKGLGEYPEIRTFYVQHTQDAIDSLTETVEE